MSVDDYGDGLRLTGRAVAQIGAHGFAAMQTALHGCCRPGTDTAAAVEPLADPAAEELQRLLVTFNATEVDCPLEQPLHALFEAQVRRKPDAIAARPASNLTYEQLNERANRLAITCVNSACNRIARGDLRRARAGSGGRSARHSQGWRRLCAAGPGLSAGASGYMLQDSAPVAVLVQAPRGNCWVSRV
jgi:arthrofactin-type cyclic lipopeptide synthetase A